MRYLLLAACLAGVVAGHNTWAQEASASEADAVSRIAECLVQGLPADWVEARMEVGLPEPGASSGNVRYLVSRKGAEDKPEPFTPCDTDVPAKILVDLRATQPQERRGWTVARLSIGREGGFRVGYEFPKK